MRLVEQAKQGKSKSVIMGLAFCTGVLLFFACLAGANIVLKLVYNTTLQWATSSVTLRLSPVWRC